MFPVHYNHWADALIHSLVLHLPPWQVVNNSTNSIDSDKVDYLPRDVLMTGAAQDCSQLIPLMTQHCKVSGKDSARACHGLCAAVERADTPLHIWQPTDPALQS